MKQIDWEALRKEVSPTKISYEVDITPNNVYAQRKHLLAYCRYFQSLQYKSKSIQHLSRSVWEWLIDDTKKLRDSINEDMHELNVCYEAAAYKATLILAGSILEAFLIDWLSEIDGKNYFVEPYKRKIRKSDGKEVFVKCDKLEKYIDSISEIERPHWMEEKKKADFIRKNRNSVHAKICLKKELDINQDTCLEVITYLTNIIEARLSKRKKELGEM